MEKLESIIEKCIEITRNPQRVIEDYYNETGKKAVGCLPIYTPEEIVHAAGLLPIGIWGGQAELKLARAELPAFACSIMQSVTEFKLRGKYKDLAAVIVPSPCDTLKAIGQKWNVEGVPCIQFVHPNNRHLEASKTFLKEEYQIVREKLERIIGYNITDEMLSNSIEVYNNHRKIMREFVKVASDYPTIITPRKRHAIMKSAFFMKKEENTEFIKKIIMELKKQKYPSWDGIRAIVTGIMIEPDSVNDIFEELNISIVGDDLAQESRQYRVDTPKGENQLEAMAERWQLMHGCSVVFDQKKSRVKMLTDMKKLNKADCVIVCMMKFCDPEEFDYPIIIKEMEKHKIPMLQIEIDQQTQSVEQIRTRLQSFKEIIENSNSLG